VLEKKDYGIRTYVALTSSFAGTGGIVEAMMSCVACAGHNVVASACARSVSYVLCEAPRLCARFVLWPTSEVAVVWLRRSGGRCEVRRRRSRCGRPIIKAEGTCFVRS
jgi:hypothetical protein